MRAMAAQSNNPVVSLTDVFKTYRTPSAPKVFKLGRIALGPRELVELKTSFSLAVHTTRVLSPGRHAVDVIVNGQAMSQLETDEAVRTVGLSPNNGRNLLSGRPPELQMQMVARPRKSLATNIVCTRSSSVGTSVHGVQMAVTIRRNRVAFRHRMSAFCCSLRKSALRIASMPEATRPGISEPNTIRPPNPLS